MRKFYAFVLAALFSLAGLSANAFTITIKADPALVRSVQIGDYTDVLEDVASTYKDFSAVGTVNTFNVTGTIYCRVTTITSGKEYNVRLTSSGGASQNLWNSLQSKPTAKNFSATTYDGGTLEVFFGETPKVNFNVVVNGKASKFTFAVGQTTKVLVAGTNAMQCTEKDYITITPASGVAKLYQVLLGTREYYIVDNMGTMMYQIQGSDVTEGATLTINTEFPDIDRSCSITCNDWDFITSVKLDGTALNPAVYKAKSFTAKEGQTLTVVGDKANYQVNSVLANNLPLPGFSGTIEKSIDGDYSLSFDVAKLVRDKNFTIQFAADVEGGYTNGFGVYFPLAAGVNTQIAYCADELPITVSAQTTSSSTDSRVVYVYRNGSVVHAGPSYKLTEENLVSGDVYRFQLETPKFAVNVTGANFIDATLYGETVSLREGKNTLTVNYEEEIARFEFSAKDGSAISTATVDGRDIVPDSEGVYSIYPTANANVVIEAVNKPIVTVYVNDVAGLEWGGVVVDDALVELKNGKNVIDLSSEELAGGELLMVAPNAEEEYSITKILLNGTDITGNPTYLDTDGAYYFTPIKSGSVLDITAEKAAPQYVTINVNDAAGLLYGVVIVNYDDGYIFVEDGENKVDISQIEGGLKYYQFMPNVEASYSMVSVTLNGKDVTESGYDPNLGRYNVMPAKVGDVLDINVAQVEREDLLVVYVSGTQNVERPYIYNSWGAIDLGGELKDGYQNVLFNEGYDCPLMCGYEMLNEGINAYCFYNNERVVYDWCFNINATSNGVLKYYFQESEPEPVVDYIEVRGSANAPKILVDYVAEGYVMPILRGMETAYTHTELPGTLAVLSSPAGDKYNEVYINGELVLPGESGEYVYYMTKDQDILIYANDETGISTIGVDADKASEVYNLQGIKVSGKDLPAGFYIVNGKKVAKF